MSWAVISPILAIGLAAGLTPGPTATLVITQTLRYGLWEGAKVAMAPLITDVPIMIVALLTLNHLQHTPVIFGIISLAGAIFLLYLAVEIFFSSAPSMGGEHLPSRSLTKGVVTNLLNPGPYLFWGTVGTPMLLNAAKVSYSSAITAALLFLTLIVGGKFAMALLAKYSSNFLRGAGYLWLLRVLSLVMFVYAIYYLKDAGSRFGIL